MPKVSAQGTGRKSWTSLTGSTSCWSACYSARNIALRNLQRQAAAACPEGYKIVSGPTCTNDPPAQAPSFLDWGGKGEGWVVCVCVDTCEAEIECDTSGYFPDFFGNPAQKWQELIEAWGIQYGSVRNNYETMTELIEPKELLASVRAAADSSHIDIAPFLAAYERGDVQEIRPPSFDALLDELDHWGNGAAREAEETETARPPAADHFGRRRYPVFGWRFLIVVAVASIVSFVIGTLF
jgi:hypothetical protein